MKIHWLLSLACLASAGLRAENEVGFIEKFALAPDRAAVLGQLVPGTEDFYFFHALHFQNTRNAVKLRETMAQWAKRFPESEPRKIIENREALLSYDSNPQATLKFLRKRIGVDLNHERETPEAPLDLPTTLDPMLIARAVFQEQALQEDDLGQCGEDALEALVREKVTLRPGQVRALLGKIKRPDVAGLVEMIAKDLKVDGGESFGAFEIHKALLSGQLDDLAKRLPDLKNDEAWVAARLAKLAPDADVNPASFPGHAGHEGQSERPLIDPALSPVEREAWLDRAWTFVRGLSPSFNSLKAQILHQRLVHDRSLGVFDRARFLEYLKIPRNADSANPQFLERAAGHEADLQADLADLLPGCAPIGDDTELLRDFLLRFFKDDPKWEPWAQWLRDTFVKPVFAEAKIVNGIGDPEKWASLIPPEEFQKLRDRIDLDFAPTNPQFLAPDDHVSLALFIKNAPKLIVKIYEINTLSFFLTQQRQINTDLDLDGLVANIERTETFDDPPFRRVARTFNFPELKNRRGAWVIEFIGGGKASRALIRKGGWHLLQHPGPAGDMLTVLDENYAPVKDATVWLDGRKFTVDEESGFILVPFTQKARTRPIVLADAAGEFATLAEFEHHAESYTLDAQFHLAREQLLAGRQAAVAIRAALLLNDAPIALSLLQEPKLTITATTLDGIATTTEVKDLALDAAKEFTHTFTVPERLASLEMELTAKVENLSNGGEKEEVSAAGEWHVNAIDKSDATNDGHLAQFGGKYVFELLGKNGEPVQNRQVSFAFTHRIFSSDVPVDLRTDEKGRIALGELPGIASFTATPPNGREHSWALRGDEFTSRESLHARAGEVVRVPWMEKSASVSLLEMRAGTFTKDWHGAVAFKDGFLEITGLSPGDYSLRARDSDREFAIKISRGVAVQNWLLSPTRELEADDPAPLQIASIATEADALVVRLKNADAFTRVHVAAERFLPDSTLFDQLGGFTRPGLASTIPARHPNLFAGGRAIGDEARYILERRYAKTFPGNMLTRPGLLLNPWEKRSTDFDAQEQAAGEHAGAMDGEREAESMEPTGQFKSMSGDDHDASATSNLDFLASAAPALHNLVPDRDGIVRIDRKLLGDRQHIEVLASDLTNAVWRTVSLPERSVKLRDLRLSRTLDPAKAFTETKEVAVVGAGATFTTENASAAEVQTYDSLASLHRLFMTLSKDDDLDEFAWILQWPTLKDEEKHAKYSEFACHELNLFLSRKDPAFFAAVVQPHLRNRKDKTFLNDFLIGADLQEYVEPWNFARLNVVERALLAQRLPGEAPAAARHLRELWEMVERNAEAEDLFFEAALHGPELEGGSLFRRGDARGGMANDFDVAQIPQNFGRAPDQAASKRSFGFARANDRDASDATRGGASLSTADTPHRAKKADTRGTVSLGDEAKFGRLFAEDKPVATAGNRSGNLAISKNAIDSLLFGTDPKAEFDTTHPVTGKSKGLRPALAGIAGIRTDPEFQLVVRALNAKRLRDEVRPFYRQLGAVKEWAENNYYHRPIEAQDAGLIPINAFWRDYAAWDGKTPFLSTHVAEASRNFSEMMFALAVLDLPFEAAKHTIKTDGGAFSITAASPLLVFHKQIAPALLAKDNAELLVRQYFYRLNEPTKENESEFAVKFVTGEFLPGVVYVARVVVTNPTSTSRTLSLLLQIPRGAIPVHESKATDGRRAVVAPYETHQLEYSFYFPETAAEPFAQYPVHASRNGADAGAAPASTFKVVKQLTQVDKTSWDWVSQDSSEAEVLAFLESHNLARLDLDRIAWRVRNSAAFFRKVVALLDERHIYNDTIESYALVHNDRAALREWLLHRDDFLAQCGPFLDSKLVAIDPVERHAYEHLEYSPLVNQRAHQLGAERTIANPVFREQYRRLLEILAHKPAPDAADELSVVYYLFLQDRVEEALARLHAIKSETVTAKLQFDYLRCYAAVCEERLAEARGIAAQYADYPVDRWSALFAEARAQLDEIGGKAVARAGDDKPDREKQQGTLAASEPSLDFKVENKTIALTWKNLREVTINFYRMDPEVLFSASPFVSADAGRFAIVKPTLTATVALEDGGNAKDIPLPEEFAKSNVLVEILGAGLRKTQAYHANDFKLTIAENYGRLEVREQAADKPVSRAYVKVYARLKDGSVRFFKDGYTDLRGKFDYASLNGRESGGQENAAPPQQQSRGNLDFQMLRPNELGQVARLTILVLSETHGAAVREVNPPRE